jgi:hypothetical protein
MSVLDKWLNIHRQNDEAATSATSATNAKRSIDNNRMDVASHLRQVATFVPETTDVASLSQPDCDTKSEQDQKLIEAVANVANVAGIENQRTANVLSPPNWFATAFNEPCPERRGHVERRGGLFLHFCRECGRWGAYGYDCVGGKPGRWYCGEHRPDE